MKVKREGIKKARKEKGRERPNEEKRNGMKR